MRRICVCLSLLVLLACGQRSRDGEKHLNAAAFREMMNRLAIAGASKKPTKPWPVSLKTLSTWNRLTFNSTKGIPSCVRILPRSNRERSCGFITCGSMKPVKSARENIPLVRGMSQQQITASWSSNCEMGESRFGANTSRKDQPHLSGFSIRRINGGGGRSKIIRSYEMERNLSATLFLFTRRACGS